MTTVLTATSETRLAAESGSSLWLTAEETTRATGWTLKPEGLCRGDVCVPIPEDRRSDLTRDGRIDVSALWSHMGRPAVHSDAGDVWSLGEAADDLNAALDTLEAPDFTLPDFEGQPHSLSDFRGKKVLLITWASW